MHNLKDLLPDRLTEPPQIEAIKKCVKTKFNEDCGVSVNKDSYIVSVSTGAVASLVRMSAPVIAIECNLDKNLVVRISSN